MLDALSWQTTQLSLDDQQFFSDWTTLSNKYHSNNQLLSTEFLTHLLKYFAHTPLYQVRATCNGELACMMLLKKRNKLIWELYKPSQAQVGLLLLNPEFTLNISALLDTLPGFAARIDFLSLDPIEHQSLINTLQNQEPERYATNMQIKLDGDFESYWQCRSKNLRKNMSRYENRIQRENKNLTFHQVTAKEDILAAVDRYGMIESKGWKGRLGTALHPSNQQGQFYRDFLFQLASQQNAIVYEHYFDDQLVASRLCCIKQNMLIILKTTFDEDFKSFALGRLQLKHILETLFLSDVVDTIDFYTNASPEQLDWATDQRPIYNSSFYADSFPGKSLQLLTTLKQKLKPTPEVTAE